MNAMYRNIALVAAFVIVSSVHGVSQTATYHLHKEASAIHTGFDELLSPGPDAAIVALTTPLTKNAVNEYVIKEFETQSGVPNAAGVIPSGSVLNFALWMRKTANAGSVFPRAKIRLNDATGTLLCIATGTTALTTTVTKQSISCTTSADITMAATDRFYLWVGVNLTASSSSNFSGELDLEGTSDGNFDSQVMVPLPVPPPSISSLAPNSGAVESSIVVNGANFGTAQGSSTITFNGTAATPTTWSAGSITARVPSGATSGPVVVTVAGQASAGVAFAVTPPPNISSLSPTSGRVSASVTISGANFGSTQGNGSVRFNGTTATVSTWSDASIVAIVPPGATTGDVVVAAAGGVASNGAAFTVIPPPGIASLSPNTGAPETTVSLRGANFGASQGKVTFNGTPAAIISWNDTSISAKVPAGATSGNVVVTADGGFSSSDGAWFSVINPGGVSVDRIVSGQDALGNGVITTGPLTTNAAPELLLALVTGGGNGSTTPAVSSITGGGLTWVFVGRSNLQGGTAEIWRAFATSLLMNSPITATMSASGSQSLMTVVSFAGVDASGSNGSGAIGALATANNSTGAPSVSVTTTRNNSMVFGVGSDSTFLGFPFAHTPGTNQTLISGALYPGCIDGLNCVSSFSAALWVQQFSTSVSAAGTNVVLNDVAPTTDPYDLASVEILPAAAPVAGPILTSLSSNLGAPASLITITGVNFGDTGTVTFNGVPAAPVNWSATSIVVPVPSSASTGNVVVTVGGQASNGLGFMVANASGLAVDQILSADGESFQGPLSVGAVSTSTGEELLLALVSSSGSTPDTALISSPGLVWELVQRTNTQAGTAEVWRAFSPFMLSNVTISANFAQISDVTLTVISFAGVDTGGSNGSAAIGAVGTANSAAGAPSGSITTTRNNSMVFAAGNDPSGATTRSPGSQQTIIHQAVNPCVVPPESTLQCLIPSNTVWAQRVDDSINASGSSVTVADTAPAADAFNLSIVEVRPPIVPPAITSLSPASGPASTTVTISGSNFGATAGTSAVTFGGITVTPDSWTPTAITVKVPVALPLGPASVVVTVPGEGTSNPATFTVVAPLAISATATPAANAGWYNSNVSISYQCAGGVTPVQCPPSQTVTTEGAQQVITATATDAIGESATAAVTLNIDKTAPSLSITSPANNAIVTTPSLQVSGTVADNLSGATAVTCNGAAATFAAGTFSCVVTLTAGTNAISVVAADAAGNSISQTVSVIFGAPSITDINPKAGPERSLVTVTGANFGGSPNGGSVTFNGIPAAINGWTDTSISVLVPLGATTGNVVVTLAQGISSNPVVFGVPPVITAITPGRGGIDATVAISGSKFGAAPGQAVVTFDGIPANQVNWSPSEIDVTVPDGLLPGTAFVQVAVGSLESNTVNFTVTDPLMITPTNLGMLVGEVRPFQVLDVNGAVLTGVDVQIDNTAVARVNTDPTTLAQSVVAQTAGTATLHAVLGDRTGKAPLTVYSGSQLPVGAMRWDIPTLGGFTARVNNYVRARRVNEGDPDFFVNEFGGGARLRAITSDGLQAWIYPDPASSDAGIFVSGSLDGGAIALRATSAGLFVTKVDSKGAEVWRQQATDLSDIAVSADGIVFLLNAPFQATASVVGLSEIDGTPQFTAFLPTAVNRDLNFTFDAAKNELVCASGIEVDVNQYPKFGKIAVGSDGALYVPYTLTSETLNAAPCKDNDPVPNPNSTLQYAENFAVLRVGSDGISSTQPVDSITFLGTGWQHAINSVAPADVTTIPDGTDGILLPVRRSIFAVDDLSTTPTIQMSVGRVSSAGYQEYPLPFAQGGTNDQNLMLGEDGSFVVAEGGNVGAFDSNGVPLFTYSGTSVRLSGTTTDGGVVLQDGNGEHSTDTKFVAADGSVRPLLQSAGLSVADHWANDLWVGIFDGFAEVAGEPVSSAGSDCPRQGCGAMPNSPAAPVITTFVPPHIEATANATFTSFSVPADLLKNAPASRAHQRFYIRNGSQNLTLAAREESFEKEVNTSVNALGFIGHSLEVDNSGLLHSIGMNFWYPVTGSDALSLYPEPLPQRQIQLGEQCVAATDVDSCQFPLQKDSSTVQGIFYQNVPASDAPPGIINPPPMGKLIDKIPAQAKIVFIGACNLDPQYFQQHGTISPFLQMWDVHNQYTQLDGTVVPATKGRALVVAQSQSTFLIDAYDVWARIVKDLLGDPKRGVKAMNLQDAVTDANKFLLTIPGNSGEQWAIVGDPTLRLR